MLPFCLIGGVHLIIKSELNLGPAIGGRCNVELTMRTLSADILCVKLHQNQGRTLQRLSANAAEGLTPCGFLALLRGRNQFSKAPRLSKPDLQSKRQKNQPMLKTFDLSCFLDVPRQTVNERRTPIDYLVARYRRANQVTRAGSMTRQLL